MLECIAALPLVPVADAGAVAHTLVCTECAELRAAGVTLQILHLQLATQKLRDAAGSFEDEAKRAQSQLSEIQQSSHRKEEELYTKARMLLLVVAADMVALFPKEYIHCLAVRQAPCREEEEVSRTTKQSE